MSDKWFEMELSRVCRIQSGAGFPKKFQGNKDQPIPFYKVSDMNLAGNEELMKIANNYISEDIQEELGAKLFPAGSIIFPKVGGAILTNKKRIISYNSCVDNNVMGLIPKTDIIEPLFLRYFLESLHIYEWSNKANPPSIRQTTVSNWPIRLPDISEQKRIVATLDEAFAGIDAAIANTEKNLANARELFESYLSLVFSQRGKRWIERTLSEVATITSKLVDPKEPKYQNILHVGAGNIVSMEGDLIALQTAGEEGLKSGKFEFDKTMVLYSKIRPYLMKVVRPGFSGLCSADIYPLFPKGEFLCRDFLYYLLLSNDFTDYAIAGSARAGMPKVNRGHLFAYSVALPEIDEQKMLIEGLDAVAIETRRLESMYQQKLIALAELKQSLLQKAFAGDLTAKNIKSEAR